MSITDEDIRKTVSECLQQEIRLADSRIRVETVAGKVTLTGTAETYLAAAVAQECTAGVAGVKKVVNRIRVESPEKIAPPTDEAIRARILAALALRPRMKPTDLVLAVSNGIVFIDGFVETLDAKRHIQKLVESESGVLDVRDNLVVVPARERGDSEIAQDILLALESHALAHTNSIAVGVEMGSVTLNGMVPDETAREFIKDAVAAVSGVVELHDRLQVAEEPGPA